MAVNLRVPEKAFGIAMWVMSILLAGFIIGLGNLVIGDLPQATNSVTYDQFIDSSATQKIQSEQRALTKSRGTIEDKLQLARLQLNQAQKASQTGTETFQAWIAARTATTNPQQDPEVITRTKSLEQLKDNERSIQLTINDLDNELVTINQRDNALSNKLSELNTNAQPAYEKALFGQELRIFALRLALALPMLLIAAWMVIKKRNSEKWPMMRGFVLAAVFVFFVELVPYLPSYGGYVRYIVGIGLTLVAGHYLIKNMRAYLIRRQLAEQQVETERRKMVSHDEAFKKMAAKVCPGCDRAIAAMENAESNFCVHCGMTLFNRCHSCKTRKMAFFKYCLSCGTSCDEVRAGELIVQGT